MKITIEDEMNFENEKKYEEIDVVFLLTDKIRKGVCEEWQDEETVEETVKEYIFTDFDSAVNQMVDIIQQEAQLLSELPAYFQQKDEADSMFECEANSEQVSMLERALYAQHILGRGNLRSMGVPNIIALWDEQREYTNWDDMQPYFDFLEVLKAHDKSVTNACAEERAIKILEQLLDGDWAVRSSQSDCIRKVEDRHCQYGYVRTMRMKAIRSINMAVHLWEGESEYIKGNRYASSKKGKKEIAEKEERHNDLMTYMGESGLTSYSVDSEERYSMWRGD